MTEPQHQNTSARDRIPLWLTAFGTFVYGLLQLLNALTDTREQARSVTLVIIDLGVWSACLYVAFSKKESQLGDHKTLRYPRVAYAARYLLVFIAVANLASFAIGPVRKLVIGPFGVPLIPSPSPSAASLPTPTLAATTAVTVIPQTGTAYPALTSSPTTTPPQPTMVQPSQTSGPSITSTAIPSHYFLKNCIPTAQWRTDTRDSKADLLQSFGTENPCLPLTTAGFSADIDRLIIDVDQNPQDTTVGIYTGIPPSGKITFTLLLPILNTSNPAEAVNLVFGFLNKDPKTIFNMRPYLGKFVYYSTTASNNPGISILEWPPPGAPSPTSGPESPTPTPSPYYARYELGSSQQIVLTFSEITFTLSVDSKPLFASVNIRYIDPSTRVFWVGYVIHPSGRLRAVISDFKMAGP